MKKVFFALILLLLILPSVSSWADPDYQYRQRLTLDTDALATSVTRDHVIVVDFDNSNADFWGHVRTNGEDVRFYANDDTTLLDYNFEVFNHTTDDMIAWVEVTDTFDSTTDINIFIYYDCATCVDGQNENNTYPSHYTHTYYFNAGTGTVADDSTSTNQDLTISNTLAWSANGLFGNAFYPNDIYQATNGTIWDTTPLNITASFWINFDITFDSGSSKTAHVIHKRNIEGQDVFWLYFTSATGQLVFATEENNHGTQNTATTQASWTAGTWYHLVIVWGTGNGKRIFINGVADGVDAGETTLMRDGGATQWHHCNRPGLDRDTDGKTDVLHLSSDEWVIDDALLTYKSGAGTLVTANAEEEQPQFDITFNNFTTGTADHIPTVITMDCNGTAYDTNYDSPYTIIDMNVGTYNCDYSAEGWDVNNNIIFTVDGSKTITIYHDQIFDADFSNPAPSNLDPENAINSINVVFTDTTTYGGLTGIAWEWLKDSVQFAVTQNSDEDFTNPGDYNICIDVDADDWNGNVARDIQCDTILVKQYPQGVTFTPLAGVFGTAVDFNGIADGNITGWDWNFGGDGTSAIEDPTHNFTAPGDYNVCLKATAWNTLDRQTCLTVRIYGNASLVFVDETTHVGFQPQVFINDVNYSSWVAPDGSMDINFQLISGSTLTIRAWDATHSERSWFWDINMFTSIDINASLLTTNLGDNIDFVFYNQTDVKIPNTIIEVHRISWVADGQMASRKRTNSESEVSFFINPIDCNYVFTINPGVSSYNYSSVTVTVNRPRDEETELDINGFDVSVSNIGAWEFSDQNFPVTFCIYGNTEGYYYVNVDHDDYDPRDYTARVTGDTATYTINPWLALAASGSDIAFITRNADNRETLSNILIQVWKWLPGSGNQLIESAQTDMTGVTSLNFILTNEYTINFYWEDEDHVWNLVYSGIYIPVATDTVYADLILEVVDFNYGSTNDIYAIFNPPGGTAFHSSPFDINVTVYGNGLTDVVVKTYWRGGVITNVHYGAVPSGTVITTNLDPDTWSAGYPVTIEVGLFYDGNVERIRLYKSYSPFDNSETNILTLLRTNVKNELDCPTDGSPCIGTIMIALIIIILVISSFASQVSRNKSSLAAIAFIIMGLFVYVDWIPWFWFVGLVVVGLFGFMLFRKGGLGHG